MSQNTNTNLSLLIKKQVQELINHPHIHQVVKVKPLSYKIAYWPHDLDTLYSQMMYDLKLTIPEDYPQKAPFLTFLDKIYHLNIHPMSGQVFMSILKDDWSPYLNLNAIISSLDQILEQPDQQNAATTSLLYEYQDDINSYVNNVKNTLTINMKNNPRLNKNATQVQIVEQVIEVNDVNYDTLIRQKFEQLKRGTPEQQQRRSIGLRQKVQTVMIPHSQYRNVSKKWLSSNIDSTAQGKCKDYLPMGNTVKNNGNTSNPDTNLNLNAISSSVKYQEVIKQSKDSIKNSNSRIQSFDGLKLIMIRCKQLTKIFSEELQQLQKQLERNKSGKRLKKVLQDRCLYIEEMLIQLFNISQQINIKLVDIVRKDFTKYS